MRLYRCAVHEGCPLSVRNGHIPRKKACPLYPEIADETSMLSQFPVCLKFRMIYDPVFD
jgi:hypothetical protein